MPNKRARKRREPATSRPRRRPGTKALAALLCLLLVGAAAAQWGVVRRAVNPARLLTYTQQPGSLSPDSPTKEYVYAGGRLIATEEPAVRSPYGGSARQLPGVVQAEDFDEGSEGLAYHDTDPTDNVMNAYRPDPSGVDIEGCGDAGGGFNVGFTWAGEWTEYTVSVAASGTYDIEVRVASGNGGGGSFHVAFDGQDVTGPLGVPNTGGWQTYQSVVRQGVQLTAGLHLMRLSMDTAGPQGGVANFNYVRVTSVPAGTPPTNLLATATSPTQVSLTWTAPAGTVSRYEVERSQSAGGGWTPLSTQVTATSYADTTAAANTAYLYRARAVFTSGGMSDYSNRDLATTVLFTDDPLAAGVTAVKGAHVTQLRQAVAAVRSTAGLAPASWTDAALSGVAVKGVHVSEMRARLDEALAALGLPLSAYTDATLPGTTIKKVHVEELRQRVK